ncbi:MAG TPA: class I SAM-dependent methyltransferase [Pirellulales bacterium]|nr:class I SAM-dependent methyltransferase [Pirellulales bacterium]
MNEFDAYVETYDCACQRGLSLTGEDRDYYARRRVAITRTLCSDPAGVRQIIDFGCGLGHTAPLLLSAFPNASVLGIDNSRETIERACLAYGSKRVSFTCDDGDWPVADADLIYCNGVFHHIPKADRPPVVDRLLASVRPGGVFALWENNPWNPGTRLVMRRIPFDRDAITLSYREASALVRDAGFCVDKATFHFYFPALLNFLRSAEPLLSTIPLGGQYCVLARRPVCARSAMHEPLALA